jgi:N-acetylated-alpha-linked acidic dipeptidase
MERGRPGLTDQPLSMKAVRAVSVAALTCALTAISPVHTTLYGYGVLTSDRERAAEQLFLDLPSASAALDDATMLTTTPHYAGSAGDYRVAVAMRDRLREAGFTATIETLEARVDTPKMLALTLVPSGTAPPDLTSVGVLDRPKALKAAAGAPGGPPAAVTNFELRELPEPSDPDTANPAVGIPFVAGSADGNLTAPAIYAARGVDADYAALAAHGIDVRGGVLLLRYGADLPGVLVRRAQARGAAAVVFYSDPADDGGGAAYPDGPARPLTSVARATAGDGVTIPVLAVSAITARTILGALHGPSAPPPWTGGLATAYPFARGPAALHVTVELNRKTVTLWNTIGTLHGTRPGTILLGAHRDAWVYGVGEDGGGLITILEVARGLGFLRHGGWQPGRTIVVAGWDGAEIGGYGSVAYIKAHPDAVRGTVAYVSAEENVTGRRFGVDGAAPIRTIVADVTQLVPDPARPGTSIYDTWWMESRARRAFRAGGRHGPSSPLFGAGTPGINAGFIGPFGVAHSSYDTVRYASLISDPDFVLHRTIAQVYGLVAMRLADADVVPYHFSAYVAPMQHAVHALQALARAKHAGFDLRDLNASIARFAASARRYDAATMALKTGSATERALEAARIVDVTAYGMNGYATLAFPDITAALRDGAGVDVAVQRTRTTLEHAAALLAI